MYILTGIYTRYNDIHSLLWGSSHQLACTMTSPIEADWTTVPVPQPAAATGDEPPTYREVVANGHGVLGGTERRPLLPADTNSRPTAPTPQSRAQFNINKFVLLWMGVGYPYSFCCCLLHLIFFGAGVTVVVFAVASGHHNPLEVARVLTIAAGFSFILLGSLWPCTWYFHNNRKVRFTPVVCYAWILSILFVGVGGALASQVYEHFETMWKVRGDLDSAYPLWTIVPMGGIVSLFAIVTCLLCACYPLAGQIW